MLTTAGLGIGKAVLVSRNQTVSSTTFEWITGVVVALMYVFGYLYLSPDDYLVAKIRAWS